MSCLESSMKKCVVHHYTEYIVRLIGQVITVSLETVQLVRRLNDFSIVETAIS
jgi:predicted helicase